MIQLFENGKLKWTMEPVGNVSQSDFVILPKELATGCSMSADSFDKIVWANISMSGTNKEAYEKAEQLHEQYFSRRKYNDYQTYKSSKSQRLKR